MEFNPNQISGQCGKNISVEPAPLIPHANQLTFDLNCSYTRKPDRTSRLPRSFPSKVPREQ